MVGDAHQLSGNLVGRKNEIDVACLGRTLRHALHACRIVLRECDSPFRLDFLRAARSIRSGTREDDRDGPATLIFGKRNEEIVDH